MGVARLPLLDFNVLHEEVQRVLPTLPEHIKNRDCPGVVRHYVHMCINYHSRFIESMLSSVMKNLFTLFKCLHLII